MTAEEWTEERLREEYAKEITEPGMPPAWWTNGLIAMGRWLDQGDGVAVYQNQDLGHYDLGARQWMSYGSPAAQLEEDEAPERLPDIGNRINWRFRLLATCRRPLQGPEPLRNGEATTWRYEIRHADHTNWRLVNDAMADEDKRRLEERFIQMGRPPMLYRFTKNEPESAIRYRVDVLAAGETHWAHNALTFPTEGGAREYGLDLGRRWTSALRIRVVPTSTPERELYEPGTGIPV